GAPCGPQSIAPAAPAEEPLMFSVSSSDWRVWELFSMPFHVLPVVVPGLPASLGTVAAQREETRLTIIFARLFSDHARARGAVDGLEAAGFSADHISVVSPQPQPVNESETEATPVETGAALGGVAGVGTGILAALGAITVPGFGPLLASGALATLL